MKKSLITILALLFSLNSFSFQNNLYSAFHCAYMEEKNGELKRMWESLPEQLVQIPSLGRYDDFGSFILGNDFAMCFYTSGNEDNTINTFIVSYEGPSINLAPGLCGFLGIRSYRPTAEPLTTSGQYIYTKRYHAKADKIYHFVFSVIDNLNQYSEDKCKNIIKSEINS